MTIRTVTFNPINIENPNVATRTFNSDFKVEDLEYHAEVTQGACITGLLRNGDNRVKLGFWDRTGTPVFTGMDIPGLIQEQDVPTPQPTICYVNIYRSTETPHGFTVGSKTGTYEDLKARGQRNSGGNYLGTVPISINLSDVESNNPQIETFHEEWVNRIANDNAAPEATNF